MWPTILMKVGGWLIGGGVSAVMGPLTDVYKAKLAAGNDHDRIAADLAARQIVLDQREAELQAGLAREPGYVRQLFGYAVAFWVAKILVWDKALHLGVTDALDDHMTWIVQTIIVSYFGGRTARDIIAAFRGR